MAITSTGGIIKARAFYTCAVVPARGKQLYARFFLVHYKIKESLYCHFSAIVARTTVDTQQNIFFFRWFSSFSTMNLRFTIISGGITTRWREVQCGRRRTCGVFCVPCSHIPDACHWYASLMLSMNVQKIPMVGYSTIWLAFNERLIFLLRW